MKIFLRMVIFAMIGDFVSSILVVVIIFAVIQPLPADIHERAAQGNRAATLEVALQGERINSVTNVVFWPLALGIAYGLERGWRARRHQAGQRWSGWLRWLGAGAFGFIAAVWVFSAYTLLLLPTFSETNLARFIQQLEARSTISLVVWIAVTVLAWLSGRASMPQPGPSLDPHASRATESDRGSIEEQPLVEAVAAAAMPEPASQAWPNQAPLSQEANQAVIQEPEPVRLESIEERVVGPTQPISTELWKTCPHCSKNNPADSRFCTVCGAGLTPTASAASTPKEFTSPSSRFFVSSVPRWLLVAASVGFLLLIGLGVAGFWGYHLLGQQEFAAGVDAYETADCRTARAHFNRASSFYRWSLNPDGGAAQAKSDECGLLLFAEDHRAQGDFANAVSGYETYLRQHPQSTLVPRVREAVTETYDQWAAQLRQDGQYTEAAEKYQRLLNDYSDTPLGQQAAILVAETYDQWAAQLQAEGQYEAAVEQYRRLQNEYPDTPSGQQAVSRAAEIYDKWAAQLRTNGHYGAAIDKYQTLLGEYLDTSSGQQAATLAAETYAEWAVRLQQEGEYEAAIRKYQFMGQEYPDTSLGQQADTLAAEIYDTWASQLQQQGQYQTALEKYRLLQREYAHTSLGQQAASLATATYSKWVNELRAKRHYEAAVEADNTFTRLFPDRDASAVLAETYTAWGQHFYNQQDYLGAMDKFSQAQEATADAEAVAMAKQGYQEASWGLSQDTGAQGQQVIADTWREVCDGQAVTSPAVGLVKRSEPGRAWFGGMEFPLPDAVQAASPGHFRAAVCLEKGVEEIERCPYYSNDQPGQEATLIRQQNWWEVIIRDVQTGDVLHNNTFDGSLPAECLDTETFPVGGGTKYKTGSDPTPGEVSDWLSTLTYPLLEATSTLPLPSSSTPITPPAKTSPTSPAPTASTPTAPPTETPSPITPPVAAPTPIPLESDISIDQIGEREVTDVDLNPRNPREVYVLVKGDGIYKSSNSGNGPWFKMTVDGSAITAFVIDPTNPATFYAPTWNGVLKSSDGGNTWAVKANGLGIPNRSVDVLTVHPANANLTYGGIGQTLIVSNDGGENWSTPADAYGVGLGVSRFYQIVIDPFNPDILYVGGAAGEIYKSVDGGRNFTRLSFNVGDGAFSLAAHPTQKDVYLAGINAYEAGIIKTENGADFRSASIGLVFGGADSAYSAITYAPSDPNIVYAGSGYEDNRVAKGIFKSMNGGESWQSLNNGLKINSITGFPHYVKSIAVHPTDPDIVFAATGSGLYHSVDGGASWSLK